MLVACRNDVMRCYSSPDGLNWKSMIYFSIRCILCTVSQNTGTPVTNFTNSLLI